MNLKLLIGGVLAIVIIGFITITLIGGETSSDQSSTATEVNIVQPAVQPVPNTFTVMTPEERAAAAEAERLAAEAAAALASSSASSTATSTATSTDLSEVDAEES